MNILEYNGQRINQREDGYVSATQMCQANNKLAADWLRLDETKAYKEELSASMGIPIDALCLVKSGSPEFGGGTWIHPKLAICLGRWISIPFAIWCDTHIKTLIEKGSTALVELTPMEQLLIIVQNGIEQEKKLAALESKVNKLEDKQVRFDPYLADDNNLITLESYQIINKLKFDKGVGLKFYNACNNIAKVNPNNSKVQLHRTVHPLKGSITSYPKDLLDLVYHKLIEDNKIIAVKKRTLTHLTII